MRENKLCVEVTATAEASRSSGQSIILDMVRKVVPAVAQCNCGGGRNPLY